MQVLPSFGSIRFSCPFCRALAHQYWGRSYVKWLKKDEAPVRFDVEKLKASQVEQDQLPPEKRFSDAHLFSEYIEMMEGRIFQSAFREDPYSYQVYNADVSRCDSCGDIAIWLNEKLVHPAVGPSVFANGDMPKPVKKLFLEAGAVFTTSPRASAALLRLAFQILLKELGEPGNNINRDIDRLFDKGLSHNLLKVMHSLRIIGNESVHPGLISVDDDPSIAEAMMFKLINELVEQLITRPREQHELWEMLPENKRKPVEEKIKAKDGDTATDPPSA